MLSFSSILNNIIKLRFAGIRKIIISLDVDTILLLKNNVTSFTSIVVYRYMYLTLLLNFIVVHRYLKDRPIASSFSPVTQRSSSTQRSNSGQRSRSRLRRHQLATDLNFLGFSSCLFFLDYILLSYYVFIMPLFCLCFVFTLVCCHISTFCPRILIF